MSAGNAENRGSSTEERIPIRTVLVDDFFRWCECVCLQYSVYSNPFDGIKKLLAQRQKAYQQCDFAINTDNLTPEQVVKKILEHKLVKDILK